MKQKRNDLTYQQMIHLVDNLRLFHNKFQREKVSRIEACEFLAKRCGFDITEANLSTAIQATGCTWEPERKRPDFSPHKSLNRATANAVIALYNDLGKPIPQELTDALNKANKDREEKRQEKENGKTD